MAASGGGQAKVQAPIDKPLARSYLRQFSGWSTAYPPGMSDPTSLRTMENVYVTREGAARVRPGLRSVFTANWWLGNSGESIVGGFEHFVYDATGRVALLFATRSGGGAVGFRVVVYNAATNRFDDTPGVFPTVTFGSSTKFVRYLQIDNKILALSDDPVEPAILFFVGTTKTAKKVPAAGLTMPAFTDSPFVVHPDAAWIDTPIKNSVPSAETPTPQTLVGLQGATASWIETRRNYALNPFPVSGGSTDNLGVRWSWTLSYPGGPWARFTCPSSQTSAGRGFDIFGNADLAPTNAAPFTDLAVTAGEWIHVRMNVRSSRTSNMELDYRPHNGTAWLDVSKVAQIINAPAGTQVEFNAVFQAAYTGYISLRVQYSDVFTAASGDYLETGGMLIEKSRDFSATYFDGASTSGAQIRYRYLGTANASISVQESLTGATAVNNTYSFGYFYTFETEFGESAPSGITVIKTQRGWSQWKFNSPDALGAPEATIVVDSTLAMDQLVGILPTGQYATAKAAGAVKWNLYQFTWNDTSSVPSVAVLVGSQKITSAGTEATESWISNTAAALADSYIVPVPNINNRVNYSGGPTARQGLAVGDRLVLVNDGVNQARIAWTSNIPGEYTNQSPSKGGGQKTLSTGNLLVPMNVQLWQNPQSTDTIVILCKGLNGQHAAYYMAPAEVSGQTDTTVIMGFEETTATPGTVSPYGAEVLNNALYHPLGAELMKSTAQNYNISHKTMTTDVANKWQLLAKKENIVSAQFDGRLYYIVNNPDGEALQADCMGNEIWVLDPSSDSPVWSRWLVQGIALKKLQIGDKLFMAVVKPDAIFILDEYEYDDEYANGAATLQKNIPWKLETNTLGANKAHDVAGLVKQANIHVGNFIGSLEWGIRGYDVNGHKFDIHKRTHQTQDGGIPTNDLGDMMDFLRVERNAIEWTFYANSINGPLPAGGAAVTWPFYGQIDFVQFMLLQLSANIGSERGSIETFEYQRNAYRGVETGTLITRNGVPEPMKITRP